MLDVTEHLTELRDRLIISGAAFAAAFVAAFLLREPIFDLLLAPLPNGEDSLTTFSPTEPLLVTLTVAFWTAIVVTIPVWLYQVYAFVAPGVKFGSRTATIAVLGAISALFLVGVAFGYFLVLPIALDFLLGFDAGTFNVELRAGEYVSFASTLLIAAGALFEVPVAMIALSRLGIVPPVVYRRRWREAVVVMAVIAALLPGGDPVSMLLLLAPQLLLYGFGAWAAQRFAPRGIGAASDAAPANP